jgi:hypothetical protein
MISPFNPLFAAPNGRGGPVPRLPRPLLAALVLFWCAVVYACTGCAPDMTHAHIGLGYGVDPAPWHYAADEWRRASGGRVDLTIDAEDTTDADVNVGWEYFLPRSACAYTLEGGADFIRLQIDPESASCIKHPRTVALHELGHVMGAVHSTNPADVMYPIMLGVETLTAADVAQVVP